MEDVTYEIDLKKAHLVERNPNPCGTSVVDMYRISAHEESDILALAKQIQDADEGLKNKACGKLTVILEQMKVLKKQAQKILEETERDKKLHNAACNFKKIPGNVYHLYRKPSGQRYFSLLSPEEWNGACDQTYAGSYRLESDMSWTPIEEIDQRDQSYACARKLLSASVRNLQSLEYN